MHWTDGRYPDQLSDHPVVFITWQPHRGLDLQEEPVSDEVRIRRYVVAAGELGPDVQLRHPIQRRDEPVPGEFGQRAQVGDLGG